VTPETNRELLVLDNHALREILTERPRVSERIKAQVRKFSNPDLSRAVKATA